MIVVGGNLVMIVLAVGESRILLLVFFVTIVHCLILTRRIFQKRKIR